MDNQEVINGLLVEYKNQRDSLLGLITELEKIKSKVEMLFPEQLDKRHAMFFEQKVKAVTELFKSILEIRKEISKSIKDEIEYRRKVDKETVMNEIGEEEIREMAAKVAKFTRTSKDIEVKIDRFSAVNANS